jgi:hypothetical protein
VDPNHYLFHFTDEELFDLISKLDQWSMFDYSLATDILNERGIKTTKESISDLKNKTVIISLSG